MSNQNFNIKNKKAYFDFEILDKYVAGIQLSGTEIKSLRLGKASLVDAYCYFVNGELWIKGFNISEYFFGTYNNHMPLRERKLLLNKKELQKIERKTKETGLTIVPLKVFITNKGWAKVEVATAKGKKQHDKRETLKSKDAKREMDRSKKIF